MIVCLYILCVQEISFGPRLVDSCSVKESQTALGAATRATRDVHEQVEEQSRTKVAKESDTPPCILVQLSKQAPPLATIKKRTSQSYIPDDILTTFHSDN